MPLFNLPNIAADLPQAWKSAVLAHVGPARIKVLRMNEMSYEEEVHDYNEGLLVVSGRMLLKIDNQTVIVHAGELYVAEAGLPHTVLPGSDGCLVIVDV